MPGDDQERFADYRELDQFLADLQTGKAAHPPRQMTPSMARIYRMAILFHASKPDVGEPRPAFVAHLQARLKEERGKRRDGHRSLHMPTLPGISQKHASRARRTLLAGVVATVSLAVGAGSEWRVEQDRRQSDASVLPPPTDWFFVTTVAELGHQAVPFVSESLIGYIVRRDGTIGDSADHGQILALSAVCTHKGCLVQWSSTDRTFRCPCHGGVFTEDGSTDTRVSAWRSLKPLPHLEVKVQEDGKIYVRVSAGPS